MKVNVFALVLLEKRWEDLQEDFLGDDGEVDWQDMDVEDDVVSEEHVQKDIHELEVLFGVSWLQV